MKRAREWDALVVIDLAGDKSMFHFTREKALRLGRTFRFLSLDADRSHRFDPFQSIGADGQRIIRLCNLLLEAFSLDHGIVYGGSWFSQRNLLMLLQICEEMVAQKRGGREVTLKEVDLYLRGSKCAQVKDAEQIRGIFRFLLEYDQLQPEPGDDVIDMVRAIEDGEVIYASLPAISEATTSRQIAGLLLQVTIASAMKIYEEREGNPRPQRHVHIFCDEFATIAGTSFESLLTGARKYGVSLYMAYQTTESLKKDASTDLAPAVRDNSVLKMLYTVTGERDIKELQTFSRETTRVLKSAPLESSVRLQGRSAIGRDSESEQVTTQLSKNEILDISASEGFFVIIEDGLGHREPVPCVGSFVTSRAVYLRSRVTPLPLTAKTKVVPPKSLPAPYRPPWLTAHLSAEKNKVHAGRITGLAELLRKLQAEESVRS